MFTAKEEIPQALLALVQLLAARKIAPAAPVTFAEKAGGREGGREGGKEGGREEGRVGGRESGWEGGRKGTKSVSAFMSCSTTGAVATTRKEHR
jgi:hypothetical protein